MIGFAILYGTPLAGTFLSFRVAHDLGLAGAALVVVGCLGTALYFLGVLPP